MKKILGILLLLACLPLQAIELVHGPYLQDLYDTEVTLVWISDVPSIGWVELAPNDSTHFYSVERPKYFDAEIGIKRTSLIHSVRITGLKPHTTYRYRVYAQEVVSHQGWHVNYGNVAATDVYSRKPLAFTTLDTQQKEVSFVVLNDVHARKDVITPLLNFANYKKRDLIFYNGDMVSIINKEQDLFDGFMDESMQLFAQEKCAYYIRGNHETRGEMADQFHKYFNPRKEHLYTAFREGPVYFIMLDTGEDKPDSDLEYAGIVDYDNYRAEQAEWLKTLKDDPLFKSARYHVVVAHIPAATDDNEWHGARDVVAKLVPALNDMDIDVMLCGHVHEDQYFEPNATVHFPVLVNSNNGSIEAETHNGQLKVTVRHLDGSVYSTHTYQR